MRAPEHLPGQQARQVDVGAVFRPAGHFIQAVVADGGTYRTVPAEDLSGRDNLLRPVWRNGDLLVDHSLAEIRERAAGLN